MTAPIVWLPKGNVMEAEWVELFGPVICSTKSRSGLKSDRPAGQLWERLAEYAENRS